MIRCLLPQARRHRLCLSLLLALAGFPERGLAAGEDVYKGKQITMVVSADVGNSYDFYARLLARHLPRFIPGEPNIIVQNMTGAGGLRATNWLYNVAPKDGLTIGMINNTLAFEPLYGNKLAQFDAAKFNWLGTPSQEIGLLVVWHGVPIDRIEDAKGRELILSATGSASTPAFFARVLSSLFGFKVRILAGYKSQGESFLAMERGENDGNASPFWTSLQTEFPTWVPERKLKVLVYYGAARNPDIPGPYVFDLLTNADDRAMMEVAQAGLLMGRPVLMPPGVDTEKLAILRRAFDAVVKDPQYLAECAQARLNCSQPGSSADLDTLVKEVYGSPRAAVDRLTAIYREGQSN